MFSDICSWCVGTGDVWFMADPEHCVEESFPCTRCRGSGIFTALDEARIIRARRSRSLDATMEKVFLAIKEMAERKTVNESVRSDA